MFSMLDALASIRRWIAGLFKRAKATSKVLPSESVDAGYIWAPYVPLVVTSYAFNTLEAEKELTDVLDEAKE